MNNVDISAGRGNRTFHYAASLAILAGAAALLSYYLYGQLMYGVRVPILYAYASAACVVLVWGQSLVCFRTGLRLRAFLLFVASVVVPTLLTAAILYAMLLAGFFTMRVADPVLL